MAMRTTPRWDGEAWVVGQVGSGQAGRGGRLSMALILTAAVSLPPAFPYHLSLSLLSLHFSFPPLHSLPASVTFLLSFLLFLLVFLFLSLLICFTVYLTLFLFCLLNKSFFV